MTKNKFISQEERRANFSPNLKKQIEELNKEGYHEEEYQYFHEKDGRPLMDWEEYEKTLDKANLTELIIKPNVFKFKDNKLILKDYPNLKTLYACGLGIKGAELDCSSLENLYLVHNRLTELDLSKVLNLRNLVVTRNKLSGTICLDILKHLEEAYFQYNLISFLSAKNLPNLRRLDASFNDILELFLENLGNLETLDADFNLMSRFDFPHLPKLEMLSLRGNGRRSKQRKKLFLRSPKIAFLDYHRTNIQEVEHVLSLENPDQLRICNAESYRNSDGSYNPDVATEWEDLVYRMHQQREKEWINGEWGFAFEDNPKKNKKSEDKQKTDDEKEEVPPITDPAQLTSDYQEHPQKNTLTHLTVTHLGLTGTMIIDGYPELEDLNIGNNYFSYLVIKNCPKLKHLRYAHNKLRHDAFIINCPNNLIINKENYNGGIVWDKKSEEQFKNGELKGKDNLNEEWNKDPSNLKAQWEATIKKILDNPYRYSLDDILKIDNFILRMVSEDVRKRFIDFLTSLKKKIDENKENIPPNPPPKDNNKDENKDQLINDLKEKIAKLQEENESLKSGSKTPDNQQKVEEIKKEIEKTKEKIIKSGLDENKKKELLKILEKLLSDQNKTTDNSAESPSSSHNYNLVWIPVLIGQTALLSALIYGYWCDWKKVVKKGKM